MKYLIEYEQQIDNAKTVLQAVQEVHQDIISGVALCFTVTELATGKKYSVDLNEEEGYEVYEIK